VRPREIARAAAFVLGTRVRELGLGWRSHAETRRGNGAEIIVLVFFLPDPWVRANIDGAIAHPGRRLFYEDRSPSYVPPPCALPRCGRLELEWTPECGNAPGCGVRTIGHALNLCQGQALSDRRLLRGGGARAANAIGLRAAPDRRPADHYTVRPHSRQSAKEIRHISV